MSGTPYDPILTRFARERSMGAGGVGTRLFPIVNSETGKTGEYAVFPRKRGVEEVDPTYSRGDKVKQVGIEDFTMEPYALVDHTIDVKVPLSDTIVPANIGQNAQLLNKFDRGAAKAQRIIMTKHERDVYNKVWAANKAGFESIYTANHVETAGAKWNVATSKIKNDVMKGNSRMYDSTGYKPNTVVIPDAVYNDAVSSDNELRETLKYTQPGGATLAYLASYLEMPNANILVPQFLVDNANSAQAENFAKLWNGVDAVGLFYVDPNPTNESDTLGLTLNLDTAETPFMGVEPWWSQEYKSWMARSAAYYTPKMVDNLCGYIIWDVL